eukprot:1312301-Amphidinium_carterae.1
MTKTYKIVEFVSFVGIVKSGVWKLPTLGIINPLDLHAAHDSAGWVCPMCRLRNDANVAVALTLSLK